MTLDQALELRQGKRLVFTNGVFDILHAGHVACLRTARAMGDLLIVGLNSDGSVRRLGKGANRPINTSSDRKVVLEALRSVDGVIVFEESNALHLIEALKPEVYVKGGDYMADTLPETPVVVGYGGSVAIVPLVPGHSTTDIVERCKE